MDADPDRQEIDLLIHDLTTKRRTPPKAKPGVSLPLGAQRPFAQLMASQQTAVRHVSRWTNVRMLMPSRRTAHVSRGLAIASAIRLPQVPDLSRFVKMPGHITLVRMWVGLGVVHGAAMTFWPYPKTYFWGMVLYLLSLALALVTGAWGARLSWDQRLGAAHTLALGTVLWAVTLATGTLPPA